VTLPISGITSALSNIAANLPTAPTTPAAPATPAGLGSVSGTDGSGFGDVLAKAVDNLDATQAKSDNLAVKAATGNLTDVHDYTIASTEATLATELTVAVRNKAVESFNAIMGMQV
jgi:flagellar hook-basal body complex protein FliE